MFDWLKPLFCKRTLLQVIAADVAEAEFSKLKAHAVQEHAMSVVIYEATRLKRLKAQMAELAKEEQS